MWTLQATERWERDKGWYVKKRPIELAAVLRNLERYKQMLMVAPNPLSVCAGFLHSEPMGIVALDQKGGGANLKQTRLYVFAEDSTKTIHLLALGDKASQRADIQYCRDALRRLINIGSP